ncbi:MAG: 23S rRNA (adenine(2503)-C(2))-methyltransferase RlmN [Lentisphaerae bacterium]|nr:23S rRNA (adenine(2503)-C(2))-methyltransferase RlmN [Lentisphaerota bacterium]
MTLAEYAAWRRTHPQAARADYRRMMREGEGVALPPVTRRTDDEGTVKFCLPVGGAAGLESESVIVPMTSYHRGTWHTLCVSSQVGCRMGCVFCESGRLGLRHNLTVAEIIGQRLVARAIRQTIRSSSAAREWQYFHDGIRNIVFMGMGEPLDNFDAVTQAIRVLGDPAGLNFPMGQICVSTVGRIDGLRRLAELRWPNLRIAVSLNAANDRLRDTLMPVNRGMPLRELQRALVDYPLAPKAYYLIEYVLLKGVNDTPADADAVAAFCRPLRCVVNLLPYNPQRFAAFETPATETLLAFMKRLKSRGVFTKRRIVHGRDLQGACGQLGNAGV